MTGMISILSVVWRKILRKRWVLGVVFGLSLIYFLTNTFKQVSGGLYMLPSWRFPGKSYKEERIVRERPIFEILDEDKMVHWKIRFNLGNSSRMKDRCRNSVQGKLLITDDLGYVCERKELLANGCCSISVANTIQYNCESCLPNGCCSVYEYCVSCCLQPNKQRVLERFLNRAARAFKNLFQAVEDHFELCLAKCRTSSQSVQHENTYRNPVAKHCYGEYPPELLPL